MCFCLLERVVRSCMICILVAFICASGISVIASENTVFVMKTADHAEIRESPDDDAGTILEVDQDTPLLIMGEAETGWYQVQYQGVEGYLKKEDVIPYIDGEELGREFAALERDFQGSFEQVEQHQRQKQQDIIWSIVIVLMAAAIVVLGICALVRGRRSKEDDKKYTADAGKDEKPVS